MNVTFRRAYIVGLGLGLGIATVYTIALIAVAALGWAIA